MAMLAARFWLRQTTFSNTMELDVMEMRKAYVSLELLLFETAGVTQRLSMPFDASRRALELRLEEPPIGIHRSSCRWTRSGGFLVEHRPVLGGTLAGELRNDHAHAAN